MDQLTHNLERLKDIGRYHLIPKDRPAYEAMINALAPDTNGPNNGWPILLGLKRAPAAVHRHHAREGGLVEHLLEMWELAFHLCHRDNLALSARNTSLRRDDIFKAIIHHDLHKAYRTYQLQRPDPWEVKYANDDETNLLMTEAQKTRWLVGVHGIHLTPLLENALAWDHGGFGGPDHLRPKWRSALAVLVYILDEYSGNVTEQIRKGTVRDPLESRRSDPSVSV